MLLRRDLDCVPEVHCREHGDARILNIDAVGQNDAAITSPVSAFDPKADIRQRRVAEAALLRTTSDMRGGYSLTREHRW